ncbi:MAG: ATP synthase F0 subunit C [Candidatus Binatia bacterium]
MKRLFVVIAAVTLSFFYSAAAMAAAEAAGQAADSVAKAGIALGSGLAIAIAALGAALGQGRMAAAAMESIGRNPNAAPRLTVPMVLGLAFIEALAIYAWILALVLQAKI